MAQNQSNSRQNLRKMLDDNTDLSAFDNKFSQSIITDDSKRVEPIEGSDYNHQTHQINLNDSVRSGSKLKHIPITKT